MSDARDAIRRLIAIYAQLLDSKRIEEWGELFTEEAEFRVYGETHQGRATIVHEIGGVQPATPVKHILLSPVIDLEGDDRGYVWCDMCVAVGTEEGASIVTIGRYYDEVVRDIDDGRWRFSRRVIVFSHEEVPKGVRPSPAF